MGKKILWINPVATNLFDETFKKEFEKVKQPDTMVDVVSLPPASGPTHLEYNCYEVMIMPEILRMIKKAEEEEYDAAIIGCFYDPALRAAREITEKMVVTAPAESSLHIAATLGESISIIVGRRKWIPEMRENVHKYGFGEKLASFKSIDMGVHDFQRDRNETVRRIKQAAQEAKEKDGADVIILGCTIEFGFYHEVQAEIGIPVIDASIAPLKYAEFLVEINQKFGWGHSKLYGYQSPPNEEIEAWNLF
ncbi:MULTISPECIES: aspartate/glutamate racemase family protein [Geobacillus]|uniref:Hydantoin racemase n=2 Tax=Geobacillus TaxID=129337 RepID=Q5KVV4_GEOKA|nr:MULTISPECIES: aspartate/glutamate racemase family protein [Geobacillus]ESU73451.1 hydantoin racemase [Geobacillus sp. MAS1]BAD77182.1 hydantoin racemase [Geobacillus kaustophilus HTA426]